MKTSGYYKPWKLSASFYRYDHDQCINIYHASATIAVHTQCIDKLIQLAFWSIRGKFGGFFRLWEFRKHLFDSLGSLPINCFSPFRGASLSKKTRLITSASCHVAYHTYSNFKWVFEWSHHVAMCKGFQADVNRQWFAGRRI